MRAARAWGSGGRRSSRRRWLGAAGAVGSGVVLAATGACSPTDGVGGGAPPSQAQGKVLFWQESSSEQARQLWAAMEGSFKESQPGLQLEIDTTPVPTGQSRDDKLFATLASGTAWDVWQRDIPPSYQQPLVDQRADNAAHR